MNKKMCDVGWENSSVQPRRRSSETARTCDTDPGCLWTYGWGCGTAGGEDWGWCDSRTGIWGQIRTLRASPIPRITLHCTTRDHRGLERLQLKPTALPLIRRNLDVAAHSLALQHTRQYPFRNAFGAGINPAAQMGASGKSS